jgi:hypothetical protein
VKVRILSIGDWKPADVTARWVEDRRPRIPEVEEIIERSWTEAKRRPGIHLFDGPMCRLEAFRAGQRLELDLSRTSYRISWGTNMNNAGLADRFGTEVLANPVGISSALESDDGFLLLGKRNAKVGYYPLRVHPFAGTLEPAENVDVFAEARRELAEELGFADSDISQMVCVGIVEDAALRQPELIFAVKSNRSRRDIEAMLDAAEHESCLAIDPTRQDVDRALRNPILTPVAAGATLLWGLRQFGRDWFDEAQRAVNLGDHEPE